MQVYKEAGKWFFDCRVCNTSNPRPSLSVQAAYLRAEMHLDEHTYSPFALQRSFR